MSIYVYMRVCVYMLICVYVYTCVHVFKCVYVFKHDYMFGLLMSHFISGLNMPFLQNVQFENVGAPDK